MKIKKVLAGLGAAYALSLAGSASANVYMQFFNEAGTLIYQKQGFTTGPFKNTVSVSNEIINGWVVTATGGGSDNPAIGITLSGELYRANLVGSNTLFDAGFGSGNISNNVMRIRLLDDFLNIGPLQDLKLQYQLTTSRLANEQDGKFGGQIITKTPTTQSDFGAIGGTPNAPFSITPSTPFITTVVAPITSGVMQVQAGLDLYPTAINGASQANTQRFQFNNTISAVPEPGTLVLLGASLLGLAALRRRRA